MQTNNRILDDIAKIANGAVSTLVGVKSETEAALRRQLIRLLNEMDLVPRDEFEAMKAIAIKARTEQEKQEKRILNLEAAIANPVN
jgi:BMFP domain-containing protein YqiC